MAQGESKLRWAISFDRLGASILKKLLKSGNVDLLFRHLKGFHLRENGRDVA